MFCFSIEISFLQVQPDKRKGLVYLYQGNDMLMHFCWKERANNNPEDDLVIFPDEIEFKKVTQNTTGRVYLLKWRSNARKLFFWMQEPKEDKDDEFCKKINDLVRFFFVQNEKTISTKKYFVLVKSSANTRI